MDSIDKAIKMMEEFDKRNAELAEQLAKEIAELTAQIQSITDILRIKHIVENDKRDAG
jgi:transcription elongation GreA/GreB family factor